ncbi:MAG: hypothetical protein CM15mP59_3920 [Flavobacteriaceae bacterium]|nr:MAG: hypothetical protein CM15mP59_3920 [Flavobacteriaceae bacterium]
MNDWVCKTGLNFAVSDETMLLTKQKVTTKFVIFASTDSLGVTYSYFDGCIINDEDGNLCRSTNIMARNRHHFQYLTVWGV